MCFLVRSIIPGTDKLLEATHALVQQAEQQMDAFASDAAEDGLLRLLEELQDETSEQQQQEVNRRALLLCAKGGPVDRPRSSLQRIPVEVLGIGAISPSCPAPGLGASKHF